MLSLCSEGEWIVGYLLGALTHRIIHSIVRWGLVFNNMSRDGVKSNGIVPESRELQSTFLRSKPRPAFTSATR